MDCYDIVKVLRLHAFLYMFPIVCLHVESANRHERVYFRLFRRTSMQVVHFWNAHLAMTLSRCYGCMHSSTFPSVHVESANRQERQELTWVCWSKIQNCWYSGRHAENAAKHLERATGTIWRNSFSIPPKRKVKVLTTSIFSFSVSFGSCRWVLSVEAVNNIITQITRVFWTIWQAALHISLKTRCTNLNRILLLCSHVRCMLD